MSYLEFRFDDQVTKHIREQELATSQKFVILSKDKSFGKKDALPLEGKKLSWENKSIPSFNGVPFQVVGTKTYECHLGKDRKTRAKEKYAAEMNKKALEVPVVVKRRKLLINTKKVDCKAMINIAHIIRFPDFKIEESTVRSKTEASRALKKALGEMPRSVRSEVIYCVRFPALSEHCSHAVVGEEAHVREAVDIRVRQKIEQLTVSGVRKVAEVKRHLHAFVVEELFPGEQPPPPWRRRFFPTVSDIRNVMFKTKSTRESGGDQRHTSWSEQRAKKVVISSLEVLRQQCVGHLKEITELTDRLQEGCVVHAGAGTPLQQISDQISRLARRSNVTSIQTPVCSRCLK
ncbi:hypothetical protein DPEC_G00249540 [Dallia pectoralis]|uniref:Uncharacterized protein n=1 Tax=Dallia pectoralis TaxID=75939 RepID=A0ACC2FSX0_DALPE|nr:hypothetical protein DPEC_G00249540 [Dallia pectoralis]